MWFKVILDAIIKMDPEYDKLTYEELGGMVREFKLRKLKRLQRKYKYTNNNNKRSGERRITKVRMIRW